MLPDPKVGTIEPATDRRGHNRRRLRLEAAGSTSATGADNVLIHDLSETGVLLEASPDLVLKDVISVELPDGVQAQARVVWTSGHLVGCAFDQPITRASINSALLRAPFPETFDNSPAAAPGEIDPSRSNAHEFGADEETTLGTKIVVIAGLAIASWAFVGLMIVAVVS